MNKNCHKINRKATDQEDYNKLEEENFKYIILPEYITKDKNLTDKEKTIYSMILTLS